MHALPGGEHKFLADHVVDGRILMPATSYVVTAWEAAAFIKVLCQRMRAAETVQAGCRVNFGQRICRTACMHADGM
jgi:hypothetical protein